MKYRYQAKTKDGELQTGFVEAATRDSAANILSSHELFVLLLEEAERPHFYDRLGRYFGRVSRKDMVLFTRQLAILLEARLALNKALRTLQEQATQPRLKEALYQIVQDIDAGLSFSQALERQDQVFSQFFVSMIRSSEVTGNMNEAVTFLADYTEKEGALASKALGAMIYPVILSGLFVVVAGVLIVYVFPQLAPIFEGSSVKLPIYTQILLSTGKFMSQWWYLVLGIIGAFITLILNYIQTKEGKAFFDELKVQTPFIKKIYVPLTVTRFSNSMAVLLRGGVPVAQGLEIVSHTVSNTLYEDILHEVSELVRQGETISQAMTRYPDFFPQLLIQMLVVGETTGRLDEILDRVSSYYTRETDRLLNVMVELIQPLMMVGLGVMVGFLFAALLIPLYQLSSSF